MAAIATATAPPDHVVVGTVPSAVGDAQLPTLALGALHQYLLCVAWWSQLPLQGFPFGPVLPEVSPLRDADLTVAVDALMPAVFPGSR